MKQKKVWNLYSAFFALATAALLLLVCVLFWDWRAFLAALIPVLAAFVYTTVRLLLLNRDIRGYLADVSSRLDEQNRLALEATPLPVILISDVGEILWYNNRFRQTILEGTDAYGRDIASVFSDVSLSLLTGEEEITVSLGNRKYALFTNQSAIQQRSSYLLYCIETTDLHRISREYEFSRPVVLSLYIDNSEEIMQGLREGERAQLSSQAETLLEDWISQSNGIFRKVGNDRFLAIVEYRYLVQMLEKKFNILDRIRTVKTAKGESLTCSIGVGTAQTMSEAEAISKQALDMALGRGGDQVAIKTKNGYDFYGGLSKSVERKTRVRSRVVASALRDMILNSDRVILMGHRYSDLDCLGAAVALGTVCRSLGKEAVVAYDPTTTLAGQLVARYAESNLFVTKDTALSLLTANTLLVIADTHSPAMLDIPELYARASSVVVIDHHRKMVDHIDDAVIFYHEPYSSSASEMVAELVQYIVGASISKREAEALLAGIMLDTRNFVMKAGVRTFEAAAFLRRSGADTVEVKRLFSETITLYQRKAEIISTAEWYRNTAIAHGTASGSEMRVAAAQAADELLSVRGVDASFAMFSDNGGVHISARSYGALNVQLIMESLGGGGHRTMAAVFLKDTELSAAQSLLKKAINAYLDETARSGAT